MQTQELVGIVCRVFVVRYWRFMDVVEIALQDSFTAKKEGIAGCPWFIPVKALYISPRHAVRDRNLRRELHRRRRHSPPYLTRTSQSEIEESLWGFDHNEVPDFNALDPGMSEVLSVMEPTILTSNLALK